MARTSTIGAVAGHDGGARTRRGNQEPGTPARDSREAPSGPTASWAEEWTNMSKGQGARPGTRDTKMELYETGRRGDVWINVV